MVYAIEYKDKSGKEYCLFDIDVYLQPRECVYEHGEWRKDEAWRSEIVKTINSRNVAKFVYDMTKEGKFGDAEIEEFVKDCEKLDFLRSHLHTELSNHWGEKMSASHALYHVHLPDIKKIIIDFVEKWGFSIHED